MANYTLHRESVVRQPVAAVFDFFSKAENLETITPPWLSFRILTPLPIEMRRGATIAYQLRLRGIPVKWLTEVERWNPPFEFVDVQVSGPYKLWRHTHRFSSVEGGSRIVDLVNYALPFGPIGRVMHSLVVRRDLEEIFDYRCRRIQALFGAAEVAKTHE